MREYVCLSDNFPAGEGEAVADRLWETLNRYAEMRDLPPMIDHFNQRDEARIVYYVPTATVYLVSCLLSPLVVGSWPLLRWYNRRLAGRPADMS